MNGGADCRAEHSPYRHACEELGRGGVVAHVIGLPLGRDDSNRRTHQQPYGGAEAPAGVLAPTDFKPDHLRPENQAIRRRPSGLESKGVASLSQDDADEAGWAD
jgi:hypothetical protein